jgi:7-cyano-7-deazaguanine synthase in queuosine biosynthesis
VADPDFWGQEAIRSRLAAVLSFLTDDQWEFHLSPATAEAQQIPLDVREDAVLRHPNALVLFSGGADSLCATVEAVAEQGLLPVLVSHRPAPHIDVRQQALVDALQHRLPTWGFPHLSFWIHRKGQEAADSSQRSRAFLYASLGAAVASELGIERVLLGDNGIVSLNLPLNGQLIGALASRSTHPKFIALFNAFITTVFPSPVCLSNPLQFRTRAEVLSILSRTGQAALLQETTSCSRERGRPRAAPHCGYCSQCVDRRFGSLAAGLDEHDLAERYDVDIFTDALPEGEARTVAESYVRLARNIDALPDEEFFDGYPQLYDCIDANDPAPHETARHLVALLKRHATSVLGVTADMVSRHSRDLVIGAIPESSLLRLAVGGAPAHPPARELTDIFRQEGHYWTIAFRGHTARLPDGRGLHYIARLIQHPGREFQALELILAEQPPAARTPGTDRADSGRLASQGLRPSRRSPGDEMVDPQARSDLRAALKHLEAERAQAESRGDLDRARAAEQDIDAIQRYLAAATRPGGRSRAFGDETEKARKAVSKAINRSLKNLEASHPALGHHLRQSLSIGGTCRYHPDPPVQWLP